MPLEIGHQRQVRNEWRQFCRQTITGQLSDSAEPFQVSELETALENMKSGPAAGYDNILPELLKHMGPRAKLWLTSFFSRVVHEKRLPQTWRQARAKIIAIPKPRKDHFSRGELSTNFTTVSVLQMSRAPDSAAD